MADAAFPWAVRGAVLVPYGELTVHAESLAMRYALSAFEGIRGYRQVTGGVALFALDEHLARLAESLALAMLPPLPPGAAAAAVAQLLARNAPAEDCYLRLACSATSLGTLKSGAACELFASLHGMGRKPIPEAGLALAISPRRKPTDDAFPQRAKLIGNYAGPRLAHLEARAAGFDDAILRGPEGQLAEAPTANLFVLHGRRVATPRREDGILPGITRRHVIELCRHLGCEVIERALSAEDAYGADEAWLCGTALELAPIARFDDRALPATRHLLPELAAAFERRVRGGARP